MPRPALVYINTLQVRAALLILTSHNAVACSITVRVLNGPEPTRVKRGRGGKRGGKSSGSSGATSAQAGYVTAGGAAESSGEGSLSAMEATEHGSLRYEFRAGGVLRRMRYARFLGAARSAHGLAGVAIGEVLLRHGPWTKDAAIADAEEWAHALAATKAASMSSSSSAGDADNAAAGADDEDAASLPLTHVDVTKAWSAMVADGFIMHHNGLPAPFPHQLKAASLNEGGAGVSSAAPAASSAAGAGAGKKRGRAVVDDDDEGATGATAQQLYRFGWETATKRLRDNLMVRFIKQTTRGNDATTSDAATVVTTMLSIARDASSLGRAATGMGEARSGPISVSSILKRLNKDGVAAGKSSSSSASSSSSWTADRIADILGSLAQQPHSVIRTSDVYTPASISDLIYEVDYLAGVNAMQLRTVESMIAEKYDGHGARIMRMLLERGMLDEKIIADCALIDAKTCRILLFKMVMDGFLTQQELPRRPDRHPQHTYYMFHAVSGLDSWRGCDEAARSCRACLSLLLACTHSMPFVAHLASPCSSLCSTGTASSPSFQPTCAVAC